MVSELGAIAKCRFICRHRVLSKINGVDYHCGKGSLRKLLSIIVCSGTKLRCRVISGAVVLDSRVSEGRIGQVISNVMLSPSSRPLVKTVILLSGDRVCALASTSNTFIVVISKESPSLAMDYLKVGSTGVGPGGRSFVVMEVARSFRLLSRIIIAKCRGVGGTGAADSFRAIATGRVSHRCSGSVMNGLRKGMSNLINCGGNLGKRNRSALAVHNVDSFRTEAGPLVIISKLPVRNSVRAIGPCGVRSVSILGSTSTTDVCNTETSGNIVMVDAGRTHRRGLIIRFDNSIAVDRGVGCSGCH